MDAQVRPQGGLELLRRPFEKHQISKLPKPTKQQTDEVKADYKKGIRCKECDGWHHKDVVHLDYVGHAALTDRLLECDPLWSWEPMAFKDGTPVIDSNGGMWIKLTVLGMTRIGYGHSDGKTGGNAIKETIGDALRNAAMRFGAALDLWHKGDLHQDETETQPQQESKPEQTRFKMPENPGDYVVNFSTKFIGTDYKNKKLKDISEQGHIELIAWLDKRSKEIGKPISGPAAEYIEFCNKYLSELAELPKLDDGDIPF